MDELKNEEIKAEIPVSEAVTEEGKEKKGKKVKVKREKVKKEKIKKEKAPKEDRPKRPVLPIVLTVLVVAVLALNGVFFGLQLQTNQRLSQYIDDNRAFMAANTPVTGYQEDGYKVAEMYEIRSTTAISDAYISGDDSKLSDQDKETLKMASDVLDQVVKPEMSLYEKEVAVYDWMINNLPHSDSTTVITAPGTNATDAVCTPYGVLYGKSAVCVGYATTFRLFMNMLGTDCHIVHNEGHSWDLVKLDDDGWYHVDIYSDVDYKNYANFNMTDILCRNSHDWTDEGYLPAANQLTYCYAAMNKEDVTDPAQIIKEVAETVNSKTPTNKIFYYTMPTDNNTLYSEIVYTFEMLSGLFSNTDAYPQFTGKSIYGYEVSLDDTTQVYMVSYTDEATINNNSDSGDTTEVDYQKIIDELQTLINQTFGTDYLYNNCGDGDCYVAG